MSDEKAERAVSESENIRTRIAKVLADADGMSWDMCSKPSQEGYLRRADAVIAELELEVDLTYLSDDKTRRFFELRGFYHTDWKDDDE